MALKKLGHPVRQLPPMADLDTMTTTGVWNKPTNYMADNHPTGDAGLLEVHAPENSQVYQRFTAYGSGPMFYRGKQGGVWGPWRKIQTV